MITAQELRIGNIIHEGVIDLLEVRRDYSADDIAYRIDCVMVDGSSVNNPTPEPLTEEWLLKNNVGQRIREGWIITHEFSLYNPLNREDVAGKYYHAKWRELLIGLMPVQFVHQLQNLYFALTGEELKIKE